MENVIVIGLFALGLITIIKGGDWFVDSSIWIAKVTGIPSIIVGATIVSFATTLPELLVSTSATLKGSTDIAIGNAIGSVICNIGLISGIMLVFMPIKVDKVMFGKKAFLMLGVTILALFLASDNVINKIEALIILSMMIVFFYINIMSYKNFDNSDKQIIDTSKKEILSNIAKFILGSLLIIFGSNLLVENGIILAKLLKVPESVIGLTLIALGTSLPELVTGITAIIKKNSNIGIGNILGANILNISMIMGVSGLIAKDSLVMTTTNINIFSIIANNIPQTLYLDIPFALLFMLILVVPGIIKGRMYRIQGATLILLYGFYVGILFNLS
ncbi:MAG: calcium/sodium antiporter [Clostridiales bacterium]|nr:calcium/sodium antiporter [Clostridiales bacterium]